MKFRYFFMFCACAELADLRRAHGLVERVDVGEHVAPGGAENRAPAALLADLPEEPGIADHAAADHEAARAG